MTLNRRRLLAHAAALAATPVFGDRRDPYDVLLVAQGGTTTVFNSYR